MAASKNRSAQLSQIVTSDCLPSWVVLHGRAMATLLHAFVAASYWARSERGSTASTEPWLSSTKMVTPLELATAGNPLCRWSPRTRRRPAAPAAGAGGRRSG